MSANDDFFRSRKAAAVLKHGILKRYPVVFASKTGQGKPVVFLDGYAGRGEYEEEGEEGSPLLLSRCADTVRSFRSVLLFFVEKNPSHFANLQRVLEQRGGSTRRILRQGDVADHLPEVLSVARQASLFAFLDPFGLALDFGLVRSGLLGRPPSPPTEVLLHFSISAIARMGRAVQVARSRGDRLPSAEQKTADHLTRFLGDDWWQDHFARVNGDGDEETATEVALKVGAEYEKRLTTGTSYSAITMPVRPRPELSPKYVLMLFTRHTEGAWHFADAVGQAGVDLEEARYKSQMSQDTLFGSLPFDRPAHVNSALPRVAQVVERNIVRLLAESNPVQLAERVPEVYQGVLGQAWTRHARYAVKSLHSQGLIDHSGVGDFWKNPIRQL
ncbi:three-Cys-motif partner protein TcmP [Micromonospora sp. NBC_01638]|uniref:three-Cys-motif partner protein TcmP n=1 Tax=Micromonospora sp. NBC_01638 TaxID=2975982 RepID=UPI00386612D0|nr:three-Cys-motif partner protein TcmP [Micromonospora sp. NBC_01638]